MNENRVTKEKIYLFSSERIKSIDQRTRRSRSANCSKEVFKNRTSLDKARIVLSDERKFRFASSSVE